MPASSLSDEDFPAPLGPTRATDSPGAMEKLTPSSALRRSTLVLRPKTLIIVSNIVTERSWNSL